MAADKLVLDLAHRTPRNEIASEGTWPVGCKFGLLDANVSDERLLEEMLKHPVLVNRPIVCTRKGARLCRPSQMVLDLLERLPPGPFYKEDGQLLVDQEGRRAV